MGERVAILVIHGIGQQRPYETLDRFTRNLMTSLQSSGDSTWTVQPQLDSFPDPARVDKSWTRASYVLQPAQGAAVGFESDPANQIEDISLFEYYWAPITQDKITYTGSLYFLVRAGAMPFLYLASNINVLWATARRKDIPGIIAREFWRQLNLFLPLLLLFGYLLWWLQSVPLSLSSVRRIDPLLVVPASALIIRYLYIYTGIRALSQTFQSPSGWQRSPLWRVTLCLLIFAHLVLWPLLFAPVAHCFAGFGSSLASSFPFFRHFGHLSTFLRQIALATQLQWDKGWRQWLQIFFLINPNLRDYLREGFILLLMFWVRFILVSYIGDVAVYVNASEFAKTYAARTQILNECSRTLTGLLMERYAAGPKQGQPAYDRVLIAAHSLGSVIAYDMMNALLNLARTSDPANSADLQPVDLENLRGLLTFGCPLNKIFYFFREQVDPKLTLRHQTLDILHGFRLDPRVQLNRLIPAFVSNPDPRWTQADVALAKGFKWVNAYSLQDPISGRLTFYVLNEPQRRLNYLWPFLAHLSYWEDSRFYEFFRQHLL
jgi:hypothetical protein